VRFFYVLGLGFWGSGLGIGRERLFPTPNP
jgi:hypothetical protein